jgi:2'-hydroxyisoflavone reductase
VRDLATWMVALCERGTSCTYNAIHPGVTMSELLDTCREAAPGEARVTWVDDAFLLAEGVGEWMELPLWIADPALAAADQVSVERAVDAGLAFRALVETVRSALREAETTEAAGLLPEREAELLAAWHERE